LPIRRGSVPRQSAYRACVPFFLNEPKRDEQLLDAPLAWTVARVKELQRTVREFCSDPCSVLGGDKPDGKGSATHGRPAIPPPPR
jgi:hypothetical protein